MSVRVNVRARVCACVCGLVAMGAVVRALKRASRSDSRTPLFVYLYCTPPPPPSFFNVNRQQAFRKQHRGGTPTPNLCGRMEYQYRICCLVAKATHRYTICLRGGICRTRIQTLTLSQQTRGKTIFLDGQCMRVCMCACVHVCVRAWIRVYARARARVCELQSHPTVTPKHVRILPQHPPRYVRRRSPPIVPRLST